MSNKQWTESEYRAKTLLALTPWFFFMLVALACIIRNCAGNGTDPIDDSIISSRKAVEHLNVLDSTHNGFRVVYATKSNVTEERLQEIKSRPHIQSAFKRLQADAPVYFKGSLLYTDIYDFAGFAVRYDSDRDIQIHNIFIAGHQKSMLYFGENPKISNPVKNFNPLTGQGIQFISHDDIYFRREKRKRIYRYWKCCGNNATSSTDERYSHFSEEEKLR